MAVRLSALCTFHPLPPGKFQTLISVRGRVDPRAIVRLEGLSQLKVQDQIMFQQFVPRRKLIRLQYAHKEELVRAVQGNI
jgi:hypothetical protein